MFNHDPFQAYQNLGAFGGGVAPYGLPYAGIHPGIGVGYGHYPQQFQGYPQQPQQLQGYPQQLQGYPQQLQGVGQQNPWQQFQGWNPLAAGLQNPMQPHQQFGHPGLQNPMLAYQAWQQQQTPFPYPLAPQSFIGGAGIGQPYGQINPLAQIALLRQAGLGLSPFAGY